jgi:hypothetical protein
LTNNFFSAHPGGAFTGGSSTRPRKSHAKFALAVERLERRMVLQGDLNLDGTIEFADILLLA